MHPSLSCGKAILYGIAVGMIASNANAILSRYATILEPLAVVQDNQVDVEGLAAELKTKMQKNGGFMTVRIMQDEFTFKPQDVDALVRCIERA